MLHRKDILWGVSRQAAIEPGCYLFRHPENILQLLCRGWQRSASNISWFGASRVMAEASFSASSLQPWEEMRLAQADGTRVSETWAKCSLLHETVPSTRHCRVSVVPTVSSAKGYPVWDSWGSLNSAPGSYCHPDGKLIKAILKIAEQKSIIHITSITVDSFFFLSNIPRYSVGLSSWSFPL